MGYTEPWYSVRGVEPPIGRGMGRRGHVGRPAGPCPNGAAPARLPWTLRAAEASRLAAVRVDPLHQLQGDALWTLEESEPAADVVQLIVEHAYTVGDEV